MQCPNCGYEPRDRLLNSPCPNPECAFIWWDTNEYVKMLADDLQIETTMDIGCGNKGIIAQAYWQERNIKKAYAVDRHVIRVLPKTWTPLLTDAELVEDYLAGEQIDFVTHCGLLEHLDYDKAFRVLKVIERITKKRCFFTFSAMLREVDYKVKIDGNPFHYYKSFWDARTVEALGYVVDRKRMACGLTFVDEVTGWFDPPDRPFEERAEKAIQSICERHCKYCDREPIMWDASVENDDVYLCLTHLKEKSDRLSVKNPHIDLWLARDDIEQIFPIPGWRTPRKVL